MKLPWSKKPVSPAAPMPATTPYLCPHCHSPHGVEVAKVIHRFPSADTVGIDRVDAGDVVACSICGTVYVVTRAGVEERKQRQAETPPATTPEHRVPDLSSRMEKLRWRSPKV